jgi:hypothetical protein
MLSFWVRRPMGDGQPERSFSHTLCPPAYDVRESWSRR